MVIVSHEMLFARESPTGLCSWTRTDRRRGQPPGMFTSPRTERLRTYLRRFSYNEAVVLPAAHGVQLLDRPLCCSRSRAWSKAVTV